LPNFWILQQLLEIPAPWTHYTDINVVLMMTMGGGQ